MKKTCLKCRRRFEPISEFNYICPVCAKENNMINADSIVMVIRQQRAETGCRAAIEKICPVAEGGVKSDTAFLNYIDSLFEKVC